MKQYLVCPKCEYGKLYLAGNGDGNLTEDIINEKKEEARKKEYFRRDRYCVYQEKLYFNDPEFGHGNEPEPGPGWLLCNSCPNKLAVFCKCCYYSLNYKDFLK